MAHMTEFPSTTETTKMKEGEEVAMRIRKAFLSSALVVAAGLLTAATLAAADLPRSCKTSDGHWVITLASGPAVVSDGCPSSSPCVTATYKVEGTLNANLVVGLMPTSLTAVTGPATSSGSQVYDVGQGDPVFCLGCADVSRKAFKANPDATTSTYSVWLDASSFDIGLGPVVVKQGSKGASVVQGACALAVPATAEVQPNPLATFTPDLEEVLGGKCKVHAHTDKQTGVTNVWVVESLDSNHPCTISDPIPIEDVKIQVGEDPNYPLANVELSEGLAFLLGQGTCAYKQYYPTAGPIYRVCW
jgi:hypothetical protein